MLRSQKGTKGKHERHTTNVAAKCAGKRNCQKAKQGGGVVGCKERRWTHHNISYIRIAKVGFI